MAGVSASLLAVTETQGWWCCFQESEPPWVERGATRKQWRATWMNDKVPENLQRAAGHTFNDELRDEKTVEYPVCLG